VDRVDRPVNRQADRLARGQGLLFITAARAVQLDSVVAKLLEQLELALDRELASNHSELDRFVDLAAMFTG